MYRYWADESCSSIHDDLVMCRRHERPGGYIKHLAKKEQWQVVHHSKQGIAHHAKLKHGQQSNPRFGHLKLHQLQRIAASCFTRLPQQYCMHQAAATILHATTTSSTAYPQHCQHCHSRRTFSAAQQRAAEPQENCQQKWATINPCSSPGNQYLMTCSWAPSKMQHPVPRFTWCGRYYYLAMLLLEDHQKDHMEATQALYDSTYHTGLLLPPQTWAITVYYLLRRIVCQPRMRSRTTLLLIGAAVPQHQRIIIHQQPPFYTP